MKKRRPGAPVKLTRATIASFQAVCAHGFSGCFSGTVTPMRSEEHTSELQSQSNLVCRLLLEKKKTNTPNIQTHISMNANLHPRNPMCITTLPLSAFIYTTGSPSGHTIATKLYNSTACSNVLD